MTTSFPKPALHYPVRTTLDLPSRSPIRRRSGTAPRPAITRPQSATREYLRTVRAAELALWEGSSPSAATPLRAPATAAAEDSPAEKRLFALLLALALAGVAWGLADIFRLVEHWPQFVAFVRQLLG